MEIPEILRSTRVHVAPDSYNLTSLTREDWRKLLEVPELSPRLTAPFMIFQDNHEVTLLLDDLDFEKIRDSVSTGRHERGFRMITFDIVLDFTVVGFISAIAKILADANISIVALSAFSRDHLLVKQQDLAKALLVLGEYVEELC